MSIIIFGDLFTVPEGNAATNRVYTYAKGFIESGIEVHIISFSNTYSTNNKGIIDGAKFYIPFGQKERSKYFIVRRWKKLLKYRNAYSIIKRINKEDKIIAINSWSNELLTHLFVYLLTRLFKARFIIECNEHPFRHYQSSALRKRLGKLNFYIESRFCDGVFCISNFLMDFYKNKGFDENKLLLVPSTVDPARFNKISERTIDQHYIGYFGSLTFDRDNVDILIKAFAMISHKYTEMKLVLGGFCSQNERTNLIDLIAELNIQNKVTLLNYLTREEIITYVSNADILVMVRCNDLRSKASYPSKLTEFLASSVPVISVNVGEISLYLSDGVNAFLVEPENAEALAAKLDYVISNYELAQKVGQKGKELTETIFNYNYQAKRMISFINSLQS
jgi:glycosyltransferase involved in cell wall biosynthesis